jgi:hypothetical protein
MKNNIILKRIVMIFLIIVSFFIGLFINLSLDVDHLKESETINEDYIELKSTEYTNSIQGDYDIFIMVDDYYLERFGYYEGIIHRDYDDSILLPKNKSIDFFIRNKNNMERLSLTFN